MCSQNEVESGHYNGIRLNRYLAMCGLGSRRDVESLVTSGKVRLNGEIVRDLATRVNEDDQILVDGKRAVPEKKIYLLMNKPLGVVCAVRDKYYDTVTDILPDKFRGTHVFPVGRLDRMTSGLIILTNDGDLAQKIIHPREGIEKTYELLLHKRLAHVDLLKWRHGMAVEGRFLKPLSVNIMKKGPPGCWIRLVLAEGVKREIRLMARDLGYSVKQLSRRRIGKMELAHLPAGKVLVTTRNRILEMMIRGGKV